MEEYAFLEVLLNLANLLTVDGHMQLLNDGFDLLERDVVHGVGPASHACAGVDQASRRADSLDVRQGSFKLVEDRSAVGISAEEDVIEAEEFVEIASLTHRLIFGSGHRVVRVFQVDSVLVLEKVLAHLFIVDAYSSRLVNFSLVVLSALFALLGVEVELFVISGLLPQLPEQEPLSIYDLTLVCVDQLEGLGQTLFKGFLKEFDGVEKTGADIRVGVDSQDEGLRVLDIMRGVEEGTVAADWNHQVEPRYELIVLRHGHEVFELELLYFAIELLRHLFRHFGALGHQLCRLLV